MPPAIPIETVTDNCGVALDREPLALDELAQLLAQRRAFLDVGLGQDQHEFLAAVAADQVAGAEVFGDGLGDAAQDRVAGGVAIRVVDRLEVVDVDERDAQRSPVAGRALDLGEQVGEERLAVGDAGQAVDGRPVVCVGEGGGDRVDGDAEAGLEPAAGGRHVDGVVARGDLLGGLDHAPEADALDQPRQDGGGRGAPRVMAMRAATSDRLPSTTHGAVRFGVVHEEDPDHDRSHDAPGPPVGASRSKGYVGESCLPDRPDVPAAPAAGSTGRCHGAPRGNSFGAPRGPSACYTPAVLKPSGTPREPRRSAIALAWRIGRPERRPSDQTKAIRRSVGGQHGRCLSRFPGPQGLGSLIQGGAA